MSRFKKGDKIINPDVKNAKSPNHIGEVKEIYHFLIDGKKSWFAQVQFRDYEGRYSFAILNHIPKKLQRIIGYQIESADGNHEIPEDFNSWEVFRLKKDAEIWLSKYQEVDIVTGRPVWVIVPIRKGDIEDHSYINEFSENVILK